MRKLAYIVPVDDSDVIEAAVLCAAHPDFEDNLVIAAALLSRADYLVTPDKSMFAHTPMPSISLSQALEML